MDTVIEAITVTLSTVLAQGMLIGVSAGTHCLHKRLYIHCGMMLSLMKSEISLMEGMQF